MSAEEPAPGTARRFYHPELDGLRAVAFLFVFLHHAPLITTGGRIGRMISIGWDSCGLGVDLFFCLSGYLITSLLLIERERTDRVDVPRFYARRALRIWPLYFAMIALDALLFTRIGVSDGLGRQTPWFLGFLGNWSCARWAYPNSPAALLWSVSIEEQFYVLWPPLLALLPRARLRWAPALMVAVAVGTRLHLYSTGALHPGTWCNTFARTDAFAAGIAVAMWRGDGIPGLSARARVAMFGGGFLLWFAGMYRGPVYGAQTLWLATVSYPAFAAGAVLMLLAALRPPGQDPGLLGSRPLVYLGRISYGLYVYHFLSLDIAWNVLHLPAGAGAFFTGLAITLALAAISYRFLESPFLRWKLRFTVVDSRPGG